MRCCGYWYQDALPTIKTKIIRKALSFFNAKCHVKYGSGIFNNDADRWHIYKGVTQFSLTYDCAKYCLGAYDSNKRYNNYVSHRFPPDEIYFHTIIYNSNFKNKVSAYSLKFRNNAEWRDDNLNLTYFEYPTTVTIFEKNSDYDWLKETGALFVRKVTSRESSKLLDRIDEEMLYS